MRAGSRNRRILLLSTWRQVTGSSLVLNPRARAIVSTSTSKERPSLACTSNISFAAILLKALKPHCVSLNPGSMSSCTRVLKLLDRMSRAALELSRLAPGASLDPMMTSAQPLSRRPTASSTCARSVDRSTSMNSTFLALLRRMPSETARPLPTPASSTSENRGLDAAKRLTNSTVESELPPSTTTTSLVRGILAKWWSRTHRVPRLRFRSSFRTGTTIEISGRFGSSADQRAMHYPIMGVLPHGWIIAHQRSKTRIGSWRRPKNTPQPECLSGLSC